MQTNLLKLAIFGFIIVIGLILLLQEIPEKQTTTPYQTTTIFQEPTNVTPVSLNLTGVFLKNGSFVFINNVTRVEVSLNTTQAKPGENVEVNVTFVGYFGWGAGGYVSQNLTPWYIKRTINVHYFGVELSNETSHLLVQSNGPWDKMIKMITELGEVKQPLNLSPLYYFRIRWVITPTQNVVGKTLKICGGYFASYPNITNWADYYNKLAYQQAFVINSTVINIPSVNCELLKVLEN
jgi:hypothetical protein